MAQASTARDLPVLTHREIMTVLVGLMLGMLMAALSQTIVATALPTIVGELGGQEKLAWVVSAYLLAATASTPIWGKLSDLYGRKGMFQAAIGVFLAGSLAAGLAQDIGQLIGFRAVQGLGSGGLIALSQAIIGDVVSPRERGRYQGYIVGAFGVATVAGPLIGGFVVDHLTWRSCFFIVIPVGIAALLVTERVLALPFSRRRHSIDWLGATLIVAGVGLLLLMLSLGGNQFAWNSPATYGLTAAGLGIVLAAAWWETRAQEPIVPPRLFGNHTFVVVSLAGFAVGVAMFGAFIFLPQYLQIVQGKSPTVSGLETVPLMVGLVTTSVVSGRVITRTGRYKLFPVLGLPIAAVGLALLAQLDVGTATPVAAAFMLVTGLGIGMVLPVLLLATQNAVDRHDLGVATSGVMFFRTMGGALGVAVFGALLSHRLRATIPAHLRDAGLPPTDAIQLGTPDQVASLAGPVHDAVVAGFADALHTVFYASVPFALAGFVVVLFLRELPLRRGASSDADSIGAAFETAANPDADFENATRP